MSKKQVSTAALLIIGNEILSGRTLDKNTQHIALKLGEAGITLAEVRVVPDVLGRVVGALDDLRGAYDAVLTTGGLGPTHDDITVDCIASAFGVDVVVDDEAYRRLEAHYGATEFTPARQRMARIPRGAGLIDNPVSTAPGFVIGNVYAMAGVPRIMQAMLENVLRGFADGPKMLSKTVGVNLPESQIAALLGELDQAYVDVDLGSYPFFHSGDVGVSVVLRGLEAQALERCLEALLTGLKALGAQPSLVES